MSDTSSPATLRDCSDSIASLHQRMDRFYAWASQLQVECRNLKQRVGYLESLVLKTTEALETPNVCSTVCSN